MTEQQVRDTFEAWYSEGGEYPRSVDREGESYMYAGAASAWRVWQAAWIALSAPPTVSDAHDALSSPSPMSEEQVEEWLAKREEFDDHLGALVVPSGEVRALLRQLPAPASLPAQQEVVASVSEDDDGLPVGYADWYRSHFFRHTADIERDHNCEAAWRAAIAASPGVQDQGSDEKGEQCG